MYQNPAWSGGMESKILPRRSPSIQGSAYNRSQHFQAICIFRYNAVVILTTIPVFIITLIFQRQIVEDITGGVFK